MRSDLLLSSIFLQRCSRVWTKVRHNARRIQSDPDATSRQRLSHLDVTIINRARRFLARFGNSSLNWIHGMQLHVDRIAVIAIIPFLITKADNDRETIAIRRWRSSLSWLDKNLFFRLFRRNVSTFIRYLCVGVSRDMYLDLINFVKRISR